MATSNDDIHSAAPIRFPRLVFFTRWRLRRAIGRAEGYLAACQCANENHPGLYDGLVRDAEQALAQLKGRLASLQG